MRSALKFVAGSFVGALLWFYATPFYDSLLATAVTPMVHIDRRLRATIVERDERKVRVRSTSDLAFPQIQLPADELTYNVILFAGLFAMRRGKTTRMLIAIAALAATHVAGLLFSIEATYATRMQPWSDAHYGGGEQDFWTAAEYAYRLAGMAAIAFALWWLATTEADQPAKDGHR